MTTDTFEDNRTQQTSISHERNYRSLVENSPDYVVRYDKALRRTYVNPAWERASGLSAAEVIGLPPHKTPKVPNPVPDAYQTALRRALETKARQEASFSWVNVRGETIYLQNVVVPEYDSEGEVVGLLSVGRDITELKHAEEELLRRETHLRRLNRTMATLSAGNQALVRAVDEQELLEQMCQVIVETGGHALSWIGCLGPDGRRIALSAWTGVPGVSLWPCASNASCGAVAETIHNKKAFIAHDIGTNATYAHCRDEILANGCRSGLTLPLKSGEALLGAISIYSLDTTTFDDDEVALLTELADDLAYGIAALRGRREREVSLQRIQDTMEATIQALANTLEMRDAYTAGHQRRVAQLVAAIGSQIGLAPDRVHGLRLAAIIHDIGKIHVPAEILSKPSRLSQLEYEMIKVHVEAGYDILKAIDFPWPIAQIVRQHHERLDGSGYPHGIKGDDMLVESRILAVADVVEAIMAHRPYRPGLGLDAAIDAIMDGRGTLYWADAVDACVLLFREQGFSFDQ